MQNCEDWWFCHIILCRIIVQTGGAQFCPTTVSSIVVTLHFIDNLFLCVII